MLECNVCGRSRTIAATLDSIRNPPLPDPRRCFRCGGRVRLIDSRSREKRRLTKAAAFVGGVSLAALTGACSAIDPGSSSYSQDQRPVYADPPANYAAQGYRQSSPVAASSPSRHNFGDMAMGAGVGAAGGMIAGRMMSSGARTGPTQAMIAEDVAEHAAEQRAAALAAERAAGERAAEKVAVGVVERGIAVRAVPAAVEAVEGEAVMDRVLIWIGERWLLAALL